MQPFLYLAELVELLVFFLLLKLLESSVFLDIPTLRSLVVALTTDLTHDTRALHALGETANDVCARFVLILFYLDVYCHMCARI